jgi:hypothetical protein
MTPTKRDAIRQRCERIVKWALANYDSEAEGLAFARPKAVRPLAEAHVALLSALDAADAEIERLRAALYEYAPPCPCCETRCGEHDEDCSLSVDCPEVYERMRIARAALGKPK